jgi:disulfide bond formation protein DsbB
MIMLQYLNQCSRGRGAWLLMALTAFILELVALWFQHVMLLQPCVMCIYERCALFGIMGAGLVGAIAPKRRCAMSPWLIWLYSAIRGLQLAWEHTMIQLHPSPFQTCDFAARFPTWLPLDKWLPQVSSRPATVQYVSGSSCRWRCRNGWWDFRRLSAGRYPGDRCSAFQSEKTRSVWPLSRSEYPQ